MGSVIPNSYLNSLRELLTGGETWVYFIGRTMNYRSVKNDEITQISHRSSITLYQVCYCPLHAVTVTEYWRWSLCLGRKFWLRLVSTDCTMICTRTSKGGIHLLHGRAIWKRVFGYMRQRRPRSACASAQSDQGLQCPLTELLDTAESKGPDDTLRLRRMIWIFAFGACSKAVFSLMQSISCLICASCGPCFLMIMHQLMVQLC